MNRMTRDTERRSSEEIRRDVDRTRAHLDETVGALEERLTPGRIVDQLWGRVRQGAGDGGGIAEVLRDHPVPFALMGLGLGWLAVEQSTSRRRHHRPEHFDVGTHDPAPGRRGPYGPEAVHGRESEESGPSLKERAQHAGDKAREKFREAGEKLTPGGSGDEGESFRDRASESASDAMDRTRYEVQRQTRRARQGFSRMLEENPVALGAIAFGFGLAGGISAPSTETEDRLAGPTADALKREAKRTGEETAERATRVGEEAVSAAGEEVERQRREGDGPEEQAPVPQRSAERPGRGPEPQAPRAGGRQAEERREPPEQRRREAPRPQGESDEGGGEPI